MRTIIGHVASAHIEFPCWRSQYDSVSRCGVEELYLGTTFPIWYGKRAGNVFFVIAELDIDFPCRVDDTIGSVPYIAAAYTDACGTPFVSSNSHPHSSMTAPLKTFVYGSDLALSFSNVSVMESGVIPSLWILSTKNAT